MKEHQYYKPVTYKRRQERNKETKVAKITKKYLIKGP